MKCPECHTEIEKRRIPFGRVGYIELLCCEHEATQTVSKYQNTGPADNKNDLIEEGL